MSVLSLFGGMGGFCQAARAHGLDPLGVEWDDAACATREAAGLRTLQADVSVLDPADFAPCSGLIATPPCPSFSMAGKGAGRAAIDFYLTAIARMAGGETIPAVELDEACGDDRAHLVLEPLRWALALRPRWVALEQVEPVLPLWEATATALRRHGYWTWCEVLSAEQFGVPQTRRRAILLASLNGPVSAPPATHQRYIAPRRRDEATEGMFALPEPERIVAPEDRDLLPWLSMAEALGWGMTARPTHTVTAGGTGGGGGVEVFASSDVRAIQARERDEGRWRLRMTTMPNSAERAADVSRVHDRPAPTIVGTRRSDQGIVVGKQLPEGEGRNVGGHGWKPPEDPSPCGCPWDYIDADGFCTCCHAHLDDSDGLYGIQGDPGTHRLRDCPLSTNHRTRAMRSSVSDNGSAQANPRAMNEPSATITGKHRSAEWVDTRPATTVNGDPRISEPGHHDSDVSGSQQANAVRVSLEEALILQSFQPDYPVQGTKTARFRQVGDAIPWLLAWHCLRAVLP